MGVIHPFSCCVLLQIPEYNELEERLQQFMMAYNETIRGAGMDLVFFHDAMVHLMKVTIADALLVWVITGSGVCQHFNKQFFLR